VVRDAFEDADVRKGSWYREKAFHDSSSNSRIFFVASKPSMTGMTRSGWAVSMVGF
jgi:hypothetical protein